MLLAGIVRRLAPEVEKSSLRAVSRDANVSLGALSYLLNGKTWGDFVTLARLEQAVGVQLWGDEHLKN